MKILILAVRPTDRYALQGLVAPLCRDVVVTDSVAGLERMCLRHRFDAVISVGFEWLTSGRDTAVAVRRGGRDCRVLVLSEACHEQAVLGVVEGGVGQYLSLPVEAHRLRRKLCRR
ncbi:MAG: hypothetical protein J6K81_04525 [Rikenellaceae bacterium]|nr:hypothetical protein [Rikenellaceae bacterium]